MTENRVDAADDASKVPVRRKPGRPWVHEMIVAHRVYRQELSMLPSLVASVGDHDRRRARLLHRHYRMITDSLERHHEYEDEHLWPLVQQRAPTDSELAERMESQHGRIAELLAALPDRWDRWQADPVASTRESLVATLSELAAALAEHLHDEETHILPVLQTILTESEWDAFGEHAAKTTPKWELIRTGGIVLETIQPTELEDMRAQLPAAVWLVEHVGALISRRYLAKVRGER